MQASNESGEDFCSACSTWRLCTTQYHAHVFYQGQPYVRMLFHTGLPPWQPHLFGLIRKTATAAAGRKISQPTWTYAYCFCSSGVQQGHTKQHRLWPSVECTTANGIM